MTTIFNRIASAFGCRLAVTYPSTNYRASKYIDFNTGKVMLTPMDFKNSMTMPFSGDQKIDLFECRVDVWILGVAVAMVQQIESAKSPSVWQHAAYGLLTITFTYFEMVGQTLAATNTHSENFNFGFCDVYPKFKPVNGIYKDKLAVPAGSPSGTKALPNPDIQEVIQYRDHIRNGFYHYGYTKKYL